MKEPIEKVQAVWYTIDEDEYIYGLYANKEDAKIVKECLKKDGFKNVRYEEIEVIYKTRHRITK